MRSPSVRAFDWRDINLAKALSPHGVGFDTVTQLTRGINPLQSALWAYIIPTARTLTFIWRENGRAALGQVRHRLGSDYARLAFLAPKYDLLPDGWLTLLDHIATEAGHRAANYLMAEVDEASQEFEALRTVGYAVYARQTIWKLDGTLPPLAPAVTLRQATSADAIAISTLYTNVVPRLVQQVESPPPLKFGFVLEQHGELTAVFDVYRGPLGVWVEPYLHPEAYDLTRDMLYALLFTLNQSGVEQRPVYVCVRRYQAWMQDTLAQVGFAPSGSQAVMVKRLVARVTEPLLKPLPAIENSATAPIAQAQMRIEPTEPERHLN